MIELAILHVVLVVIQLAALAYFFGRMRREKARLEAAEREKSKALHPSSRKLVAVADAVQVDSFEKSPPPKKEDPSPPRYDTFEDAIHQIHYLDMRAVDRIVVNREVLAENSDSGATIVWRLAERARALDLFLEFELCDNVEFPLYFDYVTIRWRKHPDLKDASK